MDFQIGFRNGFGLDIALFKQPYYNEDGNLYLFNGFQILLPFIFVQIGEIFIAVEEEE